MSNNCQQKGFYCKPIPVHAFHVDIHDHELMESWIYNPNILWNDKTICIGKAFLDFDTHLKALSL